MSFILEVPQNDLISQNLAKFKTEDIISLIQSLKYLADRQPEQLKKTLEEDDDLTYSLVQAELLMGILNDSIISELTDKLKIQSQPISNDKQPQQDRFAGLPAEQVAFIKQLISITEEQLALLPPAQQEQVRELRKQYQ